jgi:pimeloyl-ACP methyl ester carboxylesterase
MVEVSYDRSFTPAGGARQLGAILKSGSRSHLLGQIKVPTLVIHGTADRLIMPSGGRATAAAIPNAELMMIQDMGHDLPVALWPRITSAIVDCARRGESRRAVDAERQDAAASS